MLPLLEAFLELRPAQHAIAVHVNPVEEELRELPQDHREYFILYTVDSNTRRFLREVLHGSLPFEEGDCAVFVVVEPL